MTQEQLELMLENLNMGKFNWAEMAEIVHDDLIEELDFDKYKKLYADLVYQSYQNLERGKQLKAGLVRSIGYNILFFDQRLNKNQCMICGVDLWKYEYKSDSPYYCKGHYKMYCDRNVYEHPLTEKNKLPKPYKPLENLLNKVRRKLENERAA